MRQRRDLKRCGTRSRKRWAIISFLIWTLHSPRNSVLILFVGLQLKCCGVEDARDWFDCPECGFGSAATDAFKVCFLFWIDGIICYNQVPEGCCGWKLVNGAWVENDANDIQVFTQKMSPWSTTAQLVWSILLPKNDLFWEKIILNRSAEKLLFHHGRSHQTTRKTEKESNTLMPEPFYFTQM